LLEIGFFRGESEVVPTLTASTTAVQDYLEQIHKLIEEKGYARAVDIAAALGISQASVSAMIQRLDAEGFVVYEKYRGLVLTDTGRQLAREIAQRHDVLSRLLGRFGIDEETIYRDVEGMEHHISPKTLRVLTLLTEELENNPELVRRLKRRVNVESRMGA
jgi:DtxR family transcriptional regulator, manganese transport regulator